MTDSAMNNTPNHISNFNKIRISRWKLYTSKNFATVSLQGQLPLDEKLDGVRGPFVKVPASRFANVFKCSISFGGLCYKLYLKHYFYRSVWDIIKHTVRPSRAKRAFHAAIMLSKNGLLSPEVVMMGEKRYGPFCLRNFLITRELENAETIHDYFLDKRDIQRNDTFQDNRRFIRALGKTIGRMHSAGIFHGDLRTGNVFTKKSGENREFYFLDNERTRKFCHLPNRLRLKNLMQINMLDLGLI